MARISINKSACKGCYLCVDACPLNILKKGDSLNQKGYYYIEQDQSEKKCSGCALCALVCPDCAIYEVEK